MKELKTLKDFEDFHGGTHKANTIIDDLRDEAVKWVKDLELEPYDVTIHSYKLGKIAILKHFFNLTEEDLK